MGDRLRISMIHWMRQEPLEQTVERLARSDYDGIELNGSPEQYDGTRVRALLGEHEIDAWGRGSLLEHEERDTLHPADASRPTRGDVRCESSTC